MQNSQENNQEIQIIKELPKIQQRIIRKQEKLMDYLAEYGNISMACKKAGISRETYYRWSNNDDINAEFAAAILAGKRNLNELAQGQLIKKIKQGSLDAIKYHLSRNHPDYTKGYVPDPDLGPPITTIHIVPAPMVENKYPLDRSEYIAPIPEIKPRDPNDENYGAELLESSD